jgi:hypothetical protein
MGTEYRLFRDDMWYSFDLDKGRWSSLFPLYEPDRDKKKFTLKSIAATPEILADKIRTEVYHYGIECEQSYFLLLAKRLFYWCGDAELWMGADSADHEQWDEYKITGDRFFPSLVPGYKEPPVL